MPSRARIFIGSVLFAATLLSVAAVLTATFEASAWRTLAVLALLAAVAQLGKVDGFDNVAFYATPVFFFAGALLLPPALFGLLVALPHLIEWIRERWTRRTSAHLRAWYIQPFNIAMHIVAGSAARSIYLLLQGGATDYAAPAAPLAAVAALLAYVAVNNCLLGQALVLARGRSWRALNVLSVKNLLPELIMASLGFVVAVLWNIAAWLIVPALLPLALVYLSLTIPRLKHEARTDSRTGLLNVRSFKEQFADEMSRAQRFDRPIALIVADLDLLREINGAHGRPAGDKVIAGAARIMQANLRDYDIVGRVGGEEFAIVLPETGPREARLVAERVRKAIESASFAVSTSRTPLRATLSLGLACFPDHGASHSSLLHEAEVAVHEAKRQGRNRVFCPDDALEAGAEADWPGLEVERADVEAAWEGAAPVQIDEWPRPML